MRLIGFDAINCAEANGLTVSVTLDEARKIVLKNQSLIYLEVDEQTLDPTVRDALDMLRERLTWINQNDRRG